MQVRPSGRSGDLPVPDGKDRPHCDKGKGGDDNQSAPVQGRGEEDGRGRLRHHRHLAGGRGVSHSRRQRPGCQGGPAPVGEDHREQGTLREGREDTHTDGYVQ